MKALSFHQPRAEQVIRGEKTVDVRTWQTTYRGPLAVHATLERRDARCRALGFAPDALAYGALVGTVELTDVQPLDAAAYEALRPQHRLDAPFPGAPCYGWFLASPRRFAEPIPHRGRRRLFEVDIAAAGYRQPARHIAPPPQPDPTRPFALYVLADAGNGYRVALYQWVDVGRQTRSDDCSRHAPGALWNLEIGGDALRAVTDHLLAALRASGYRATDLARAVGSEAPFYLDELAGLRLALILMAVKPLTRHDRIEAVGQGVQAMGNEEAYYWFSKCSAGPHAARAQKALRLLLAGE